MTAIAANAESLMMTSASPSKPVGLFGRAFHAVEDLFKHEKEAAKHFALKTEERVRENVPRTIGLMKMASYILTTLSGGGLSMDADMLKTAGGLAGLGATTTLVASKGAEDDPEKAAEKANRNFFQRLMHPREHPVRAASAIMMVASALFVASGLQNHLDYQVARGAMQFLAHSLIVLAPATVAASTKKLDSDALESGNLVFQNGHSEPVGIMGKIGAKLQEFKEAPVRIASPMLVGAAAVTTAGGIAAGDPITALSGALLMAANQLLKYTRKEKSVVELAKDEAHKLHQQPQLG